jgi:hypothetical protein
MVNYEVHVCLNGDQRGRVADATVYGEYEVGSNDGPPSHEAAYELALEMLDTANKA